MIPIRKKETNDEIYARIAQSVANKYGCAMKIDFRKGCRKVELLGDEDCKRRIAADMQNIFSMP